MLPKIILGLDPGSHNTGYGVIALSQGAMKYVEHGVISAPPQLDFVARLKIISLEISEIVKRFSPQVTVVEKIFLGKNADSAFKLGHIRGICLFEALKANSEIVEYAARSIKKGVTGSGAASKEQVQMMLYAALGLKLPLHSGPKNLQVGAASTKALKLDASDALALAFYHARMSEFQARLCEQTQAPKTAVIAMTPVTPEALMTPIKPRIKEIL